MSREEERQRRCVGSDPDFVARVQSDDRGGDGEGFRRRTDAFRNPL